MNENDQYHHDITHVSKSGLDVIEKSTYRFWYKYLSNQYKKPVRTPQYFIFGSSFHTYILEPGKIQNEIICKPKFIGSGSRNREKYFIESNNDKLIISQEELRDIQMMSNSVQNHELSRKLINDIDGIPEKRFNWIDAETGIKCKIKPDLLLEKRGYCVDLKSIDDITDKGIIKASISHNYDKQAAFYTDGLKANGIDIMYFVFIFVEKKPPYQCEVRFIRHDSDTMNQGRMKYKKNLELLKTCREKNKWQNTKEVKLLEL